jgi:leucyl-tRNA synthetase
MVHRRFFVYGEKFSNRVDGSVHDEQKQYDKEREEDLQKKGYRILRFTNDEVLNTLPSVLSIITKLPSPGKERGRKERGRG